MKTFKIGLLALLAIATFAVCAAQAEDKPLLGENWTLSLGGSGSTTTTGDSQTAFGAEIDLGHTGHLILPLQGGIRQTFKYSAAEGEDDVLFGTKAYLDATLLSYKFVDLFGGANVGLVYGNTKPVWGVAPEAGLRFWIKKDVAVVTRVEYPYDITNGEWNDTLRYFLGFMLKF